MSQFLSSKETHFCLEDLIKNAKTQLILMSPYLQLTTLIKKLLINKNHSKVNVHIIYSKSDLHPDEVEWILQLDYVHLSYYKNLNAKCYMNENECIISSLNLCEFNQMNNNEMGILIHKYEDHHAYKEAYDEVQKIICRSNTVNMTLNNLKSEITLSEVKKTQDPPSASKLTTSKLAAKHKVKTSNLLETFAVKGLITLNENNKYHLTNLGKSYGGEFKSSQFGGYFIWPENMNILSSQEVS